MMSKKRQHIEEELITLVRPTNPQGIVGGSDLEEILECPICYEIFVPPIFICVSGHSLCQFCKKKVGKSCPCCRKPIHNGRNYALENIYNGTLFSCRYRDNGCPDSPRGDLFQAHVKTCPFRPFTCKFSKSMDCNSITRDCSSTIEFNCIVLHLCQMHSTVIKPSGQYCFHDEHLYQMTVSSSSSYLDIPLTCWEFDGRYFLERLLVGDKDVFIALVIIGEKSEAVNYIADYLLIREGLNCAPNILKTIHRIEVQSIREPFIPKLNSSDTLHAPAAYFKQGICRQDPITQRIRWMSRVDIKKVAQSNPSIPCSP